MESKYFDVAKPEVWLDKSTGSEWNRFLFTMDQRQTIPKIRKKPVENRLLWRERLGTPKERRYVRVAGVSPDVDIVPFTNDLVTLRRAVLERVFLVKGSDGRLQEPPRPQKGVFSKVLANTLGKLVPYLPSTAPRSHQNFVDSYEGRKKVRYQRALDQINEGRFNLAEDAKLKVFVKYEKTDRTNKIDPVARVISPRDPKYNLKVGRYLKFLEKPLFEAINSMFGHTTIFKGINAVESAHLMHEKWSRFHEPVAVGLDASRFDQHVSYDALLWEHDVYRKCYRERKHRKRLSVLLEKQLINECYGETPDGEVRYKVLGTRMSGDMNTSMGNCLLMTCMIKAFLDSIKVDADLANNGDDCVLIFEKKDLEKVMVPLPNWFTEMGFTMAVEKPVYEFEEIEFCQTKPVFDGARFIMCRNPHSAIVKDSVMVKSWDGCDFFRGWLDAVGTGGISLTGGLPVFQELYQSYVRAGKKRKIPEDLIPWSFRQWKRGVNREYGTVSPEARASFYWAFGVTPDEQLAMEEYYTRLRIKGSLIPYHTRSVFEEGF
jgi:hypothetical protein